MNRKTNEANRLIARYFDGLTSTAEERRLRQLLADAEVTGREADEARAVLSYAAMSGRTASVATAERQRPVRRWSTAASVAASIIAVATLGWWAFAGDGDAGDQSADCIAYVDGIRIDDPQQVRDIVDTELSLFGQASDAVADDITDDLNSISSAINSTEP